jgi:hypothetical protein
LLRDLTGRRPPGFLEILMTEHDVVVKHHAWMSEGWQVLPLYQSRSFFPTTSTLGSRP